MNPHADTYAPDMYPSGTAAREVRWDRKNIAEDRATARTRAIEDRSTAQAIRELHADEHEHPPIPRMRGPRGRGEAEQAILAYRAQVADLERTLRALVLALEVAMDLDDALEDARRVLRGVDGP